MEQKYNDKFLTTVFPLTIIILFVISFLVVYFAKDYLLYPVRLSDETINEYTNIAQSIWDGDGLTNIVYKDIRVKNKEGINTSTMYTKGISSIDYSKISVIITLKNDVVIIQKNNIITIYLKDSKNFTHMRSNMIKISFKNGEPKIARSSNERKSIHNVPVSESFIALVLLYTFETTFLVLLLSIFRIWLCIKLKKRKRN